MTKPPAIEIVAASSRTPSGTIRNGVPRVTLKTKRAGLRSLDIADDLGFLQSRGCSLAAPSFFPDAMNLSYHGGALASGAAIQLLFWGDVWNSTATTPSAADIVAAIQNLVDSPYFFALKQYNVDPGPLGRALVVTSPTPPASIGTDDVPDMLWHLIGDTFPNPDQAGGHNIYVVFLPPGAPTPDGSESAHSDTTHFVLDPIPKVHRAWYAWIGVPRVFDVDDITIPVSHEVVEAYTNPEPNTGWFVLTSDPGDSEIADICESIGEGPVDGVTVAPYFSKFDNACIIPQGRSVRLFLAVKGIDAAKGLRAHVLPGTCLREFLRT